MPRKSKSETEGASRVRKTYNVPAKTMAEVESFAKKFGCSETLALTRMVEGFKMYEDLFSDVKAIFVDRGEWGKGRSSDS
jgi:hypothetical protein